MKWIAALLIFSTCTLTGCSKETAVLDVADFDPIQCQPAELNLPGNKNDFTIGMIGDILLHNPLYTYADYDPSFSAVREKMMAIDFLLANQESIPAGSELGLSGYPRFNSPKHIIRDLKKNGVDMLSIANNHTMDHYENGLLKAIAHMKENDMPYVGAYESLKDSETKRIMEVEGVSIGVLAYTYGLNGMPTPKGKDYVVSLIDKQRMEKEILDMKRHVDVTVVSMHWGNEYKLEPSEQQEELASWLADLDVDIIFGHHPHVLQSYSEIGKTKVFYSLGNFFSAQQFDSTNIGGIAEVKVSSQVVAGRTFIEVRDPSFFPTAVVRDENRRFVVVPLKEAGTKVDFDVKWVENQVGLSSKR